MVHYRTIFVRRDRVLIFCLQVAIHKSSLHAKYFRWALLGRGDMELQSLVFQKLWFLHCISPMVGHIDLSQRLKLSPRYTWPSVLLWWSPYLQVGDQKSWSKVGHLQTKRRKKSRVFFAFFWLFRLFWTVNNTYVKILEKIVFGNMSGMPRGGKTLISRPKTLIYA